MNELKTIGSYLTDHDGNVSQFVCYTPYGETLVDEHLTGVDSTFSAIEVSPRQFANKFAIALCSHSIYHNELIGYLFNGKELDTETNSLKMDYGR